MILVPLLNPKFATVLAAKIVRTSGSRHQCAFRSCGIGIRSKILGLAHILIGEPVATSPGYELIHLAGAAENS
jgi:hypothetical protein